MCNKDYSLCDVVMCVCVCVFVMFVCMWHRRWYVCMCMCHEGTCTAVYMWMWCMFKCVSGFCGMFRSCVCCMYICMYVCMYVVYVACIYVYMYICMYVCMYVVYVYMGSVYDDEDVYVHEVAWDRMYMHEVNNRFPMYVYAHIQKGISRVSLVYAAIFQSTFTMIGSVCMYAHMQESMHQDVSRVFHFFTIYKFIDMKRYACPWK